MPERGFTTEFWNDPYIQELDKHAKFLFIYLWTNSHCNQAGLYEITPKTISFETGLEIEALPELFNQLEQKVVWHPEINLVWVKSFVRRQSKSPKFLIAVANCLKAINNNGLVAEFLEHNKGLGISIPYEYTITTIPIPPLSSSSSSSISSAKSSSSSLLRGERVSKGEGENIFRLYEENIGQLTPVITEELKLAEKEYGIGQVGEAIKIAVQQNKRNWRYIEGILKRKASGIGERIDPKDPNKFVQGKYGHITQR